MCIHEEEKYKHINTSYEVRNRTAKAELMVKPGKTSLNRCHLGGWSNINTQGNRKHTKLLEKALESEAWVAGVG